MCGESLILSHLIISALPCSTFLKASWHKHTAALGDCLAEICSLHWINASRCSLVHSSPQLTGHPSVAYQNKIAYARAMVWDTQVQSHATMKHIFIPTLILCYWFHWFLLFIISYFFYFLFFLVLLIPSLFCWVCFPLLYVEDFLLMLPMPWLLCNALKVALLFCFYQVIISDCLYNRRLHTFDFTLSHYFGACGIASWWLTHFCLIFLLESFLDPLISALFFRDPPHIWKWPQSVVARPIDLSVSTILVLLFLHEGVIPDLSSCRSLELFA